MNGKHYLWSAVNKFGVQFTSFIGNILIARQLSPDDYGLVAMLAIFMSIALNFTESGFADWLIRDREANDLDFSTVFIHNVVFSTAFYLLLVLSAPLIARFYDAPELVDMTKVLGVSVILKAISLSEITRLRKTLQFKKLATVQLSSNVIAVGTGYSLAIFGFGYWALVAQTLVLSFVVVILLVLVVGWRPSYRFDMAKYLRMRAFGNNMLISYFTNQFGLNFYSVMIGKFYNATTLGFYNQAHKVNWMGFQSLNSVIQSTSYSLIAKELDIQKRKVMYVNVISGFFFFHFGVSFLLIGGAPEIIEFLFGAKWLPSAPILRLLVASFLLMPLLPINSNIIKIQNKPSLYRNLTFVKNGSNIIALVLTYRFSVEVILYGQIVANTFSAIVYVIVCGKYVDLFPFDQFKTVLKEFPVPFLAMMSGALLLHLTDWSLVYSVITYVFIFALLFLLGGIITNNLLISQVLAKIHARLNR